MNETPSLPYEMNRQSSRRNTEDSKYYEYTKRNSMGISKLVTMKTLPYGANIKDDTDINRSQSLGLVKVPNPKSILKRQSTNGNF